MDRVISKLTHVLFALQFSWVGAACGSSSNNAMVPPPSDAGGLDSAPPKKDSGPHIIVDPKNCVPPSSSEYCSPAGGQCAMAGPGGTAEICTADLLGTPAHAWYCTLPCSSKSSCAGGTSCKDTPMGSRCVPPSCDALLPEAGVDAGDSGADGGGPGDSGDATTDGAHEAMSDGPAAG